MIDREHDLPISRQAEALGVSRGAVYYKPRPTSTEDLRIMRRLDELHLDYPFAGSRMLRDFLNREGVSLGRRHVTSLMKRIGIAAIYRRPNTSKPAPGHKIYPYLLRGVKIERADQVWAMDITYIPMARGFVYLAAVVDVFSRRVLAHRVSITMEADFCIEALEEALAKRGKPDIFNSDQGSQFTSVDFTGVLLKHGVAISMDGRGAWRDNVFVERLWRSVKYEEVYLRAYDSVSEARSSIGRYLAFYNHRRPHSRSHGEVDSDRRSGRVRLQTPTLETTMQVRADRPEAPSAIRSDLGAIFVSLELSRSIWLITSLSPGAGEKMSKHNAPAGDIGALLARLSELRQKTFARTRRSFPIIVIQEAGLDGFWIHRVLQNEGIESHVVDPASIATSRRRRRAKTDRIDGEALLRALLAHKRGEPRVCAMVKAPTPEEEDRRRLSRERKTLIAERVEHVNRIKGLLFCQGVSGYEPLHRDRRQRLDVLKTGDGRALPDHLKAQISRELNRLELLLEQIKAVEAERDASFAAAKALATPTPAPVTMLLEIKGIGPEFAAILWMEAFFRSFANRRQIAAYAGLAPTPWQSGSVDREQGVSKAGNPRLRTTLIQLAWLWLRHQPQSALALWFKERVARNGGRFKKTTIVALARKLLVALWKYVTAGVVIEGAAMKAA